MISGSLLQLLALPKLFIFIIIDVKNHHLKICWCFLTSGQLSTFFKKIIEKKGGMGTFFPPRPTPLEDPNPAMPTLALHSSFGAHIFNNNRVGVRVHTYNIVTVFLSYSILERNFPQFVLKSGHFSSGWSKIYETNIPKIYQH